MCLREKQPVNRRNRKRPVLSSVGTSGTRGDVGFSNIDLAVKAVDNNNHELNPHTLHRARYSNYKSDSTASIEACL